MHYNFDGLHRQVYDIFFLRPSSLFRSVLQQEEAAKMKSVSFAALAGVAAALPNGPPPGYGSGNNLGNVVSSIEKLLQGDAAELASLAPVTSQILQDYVEPIQVSSQPTRVS